MVVKPPSRFLAGEKDISGRQNVEKTLNPEKTDSFFALLEGTNNDTSVKNHNDKREASQDLDDKTKEIEKIVRDLGLSYYFVLIDDFYKTDNFNFDNFNKSQDISELLRFDAKDVSKLLALLGYNSQDISRLNNSADSSNRISLKTLLDFIENNHPATDSKKVDAKFVRQLLKNVKLGDVDNVLDVFKIDENSSYSLHDIGLLIKQLDNTLKRIDELDNFIKAGRSTKDISALLELYKAGLDGVEGRQLDGIDDVLNAFKINEGTDYSLRDIKLLIKQMINNQKEMDKFSNLTKPEKVIDTPSSLTGMQKKPDLSNIPEGGKIFPDSTSDIKKLEEASYSGVDKLNRTPKSSDNFAKLQISASLRNNHDGTGSSVPEDNKSLQSQILSYDEVISAQRFEPPRDKTREFLIHNSNFDKTTGISSNEKIAKMIGNFGQNGFDMNQTAQQDMNFQFGQQNPVNSDAAFLQQFSSATGTISFLSNSWTPHLASYIQQMLHESINRIVIQLEPKELGKLIIHLQSRSNRIVTRILTEHEETKGLLERNQELLRQHLEEQGLHLDGFKVDVGTNGAHHDNEQQERENLIGGNAVASGVRVRQSSRSASASVINNSGNYLIHLYA